MHQRIMDKAIVERVIQSEQVKITLAGLNPAPLPPTLQVDLTIVVCTHTSYIYTYAIKALT